MSTSVARTSAPSSARAFIFCLSFANLCFLRTWANLQEREAGFFNSWSASWAHLAAVTLDVLLLATVLWIPAVLAMRSGNPRWIRALKWSILVSLVAPVNAIRMDPYVVRRSGEILQARNGRMLVGMAGVLLTGFLLVRWERLSARVVSSLLTVLVPAFPLVILTTAMVIRQGPSGILPNRPLVPALPQKAGAARVIWILFDEWDQSLTFDARPAGLRLPELDRFQHESIHAGRAYPPARFTILSVPSLLTGHTFTRSIRSGPSEMLVSSGASQPPERLSTRSTIFREARNAGFNVGAAGWYLPYYRLFGDFTAGPPEQAEGGGFPVGELMLSSAREHLYDIPFAARLGLVTPSKMVGIEEHQRIYRTLHEDALRLVTDRRLNLVYLHLNVPHGPVIYDPSKNAFSTADGGPYANNIVLIDHFMGEIRRTMEQAGLWDGATILLSSDHPLRVNMWPATVNAAPVHQTERVPFLLKMAGQEKGIDYNCALQTVVTKDLLLDIMGGKVTTPKQAAEWLDHHLPRQ